jgi:hypothetical protein
VAVCSSVYPLDPVGATPGRRGAYPSRLPLLSMRPPPRALLGCLLAVFFGALAVLGFAARWLWPRGVPE